MAPSGSSIWRAELAQLQMREVTILSTTPNRGYPFDCPSQVEGEFLTDNRREFSKGWQIFLPPHRFRKLLPQLLRLYSLLPQVPQA